jgi:hypothetical protein
MKCHSTPKFFESLLIALVFSISSLNAQSKTIQDAGDVLLFALPVTALTSTLIVGDYKGTWQFAKGFALNQALTIGLKYGIKKIDPLVMVKGPSPQGIRPLHSKAPLLSKKGMVGNMVFPLTPWLVSRAIAG